MDGMAAKVQDKDGQDKLVIIARIVPPLEISKIKEIKVKISAEQVAKKAIPFDKFRDKHLNLFLVENNEFQDSPQASQMGDILVCSMNVFLGSQRLDNLSSPFAEIAIGTNNYMPKLDESLFGLSPGKRKRFTLQAPKSHPDPLLAGQKIKYVVWVLGVKKPKYKTLSELLAKKKGLKIRAVEQLEKDIQSAYQKQLELEEYGLVLKQALPLVLQAIPDFEIDDKLIKERAKAVYKDFKKDAKNAPSDVRYGSFNPWWGNVELLTSQPKDLQEQIYQTMLAETKLEHILLYIFSTQIDSLDEEAIEEKANDSLNDWLQNPFTQFEDVQNLQEKRDEIVSDLILQNKIEQALDWVMENIQIEKTK
jgi:FKBP-type peptidyl-prolyl cis-trans isomerase (trigger factor)